MYRSVVLLDANDLPLFSLVVKINVSYFMVGIFILFSENSASIEKAFQIFKEWNPLWNVQYFVTDYCEAEMKAVTSVFDAPCYICVFHLT